MKISRITTVCILFAAFFLSVNLYGQKETTTQEFGIKFSGFVKTDFAFDTRQCETIREDHFLLYPKNESFDLNGEDINDAPSFNILSIQTRLTGKITGPDFLGAKTSGVIEGAFFGSAEGNINTFRMRHAFLKLDWESTHLLVGQYWHPMFIEDNFPGVVSFNTGVPFQPFSRNPQVRLTQNLGFLDVILAACSQRDFQSMAPVQDATTLKSVPTGTSEAARDGVIPDLNLFFKMKFGTHMIGFGGEYKSLKPRTSYKYNADTTYKMDNLVNSFAAEAFAKLVFGDFSVKLEGVYGQNLTNMMMLGGYTVKTRDLKNGIEEYTPTNIMSAWCELAYGTDVEVAVFGGYTKNMGTADPVITSLTSSDYYGRGYNIESVIRVAPRIIWTVGKVKFAGEVEYTQAAYSTSNTVTDPNFFDEKLVIQDTKNVSNIRVLLAGYLFF